MAVESTLAVPLRSFPYGETSLILRFFTAERGLVGAIAKGVRKGGSRGSGIPGTFSRGVLTIYVKPGRDLHTMKDFSTERSRRPLAYTALRFAAASFLGEIVLRHTGEEDSARLFETFDGALDTLESVGAEELSSALLACSWGLVGEMGYRPGLERCVACGAAIDPDEMTRFDLRAGGVRCCACAEEGRGRRIGPEARRQLRGLVEGELEPDLRKPRAHLRLLNDFVTYHLSEGRRLDSFRILMDLGLVP